MIQQAIAVMNGKGGVGKTSMVANLAGLAALSDWRVLVVDLDQQGNLENRLGYRDRSDQGAGLVAAALENEPLPLIRDVRDGLDAVAGGAALRNLSNELIRRASIGTMPEGRLATWLDDSLARISDDYDLIIFDTPPSGSTLHLAAATAAHYVVVPTAPDRDSIEGLTEIALLFSEVLDSWNPDIELLGVVLTLLVNGASAIERRARHDLGELLAPGLSVFENTIRFAQRAAVDVAERGVLAHEYESLAADAIPWFVGRKQHSEPSAVPDVDLTNDGVPETTTFSRAASGLAGDYQRVAMEILAAFGERQVQALVAS